MCHVLDKAKGHLQKCCPKSSRMSDAVVKKLDFSQEFSEDRSSETEYNPDVIFAVSGEESEGCLVDLYVNGTLVKWRIDSGDCVTLMNCEEAKNIFRDFSVKINKAEKPVLN